MNPTKRQGL